LQDLAGLFSEQECAWIFISNTVNLQVLVFVLCSSLGVCGLEAKTKQVIIWKAPALSVAGGIYF
jgi:hypothetical protein